MTYFCCYANPDCMANGCVRMRAERKLPPREAFPLEYSPTLFPQPWKCPGCSRWNAPTSIGCECHKAKDDKQ